MNTRTMPHHSKKIFFIGLIAVTLSLVMILTSFLPKHISASGTMKKITDEHFGIQVQWNPFRPFADRTFQLTNVPAEFQHEGMKVRVRASVTDVLGSGEWDVVLVPESITRE